MTEISHRIVVDPGVRFGRPVIQGTRVPVEVVVGKLAGGMSFDEVATEYRLTHEDIRAAEVAGGPELPGLLLEMEPVWEPL